MKGHLDVKVYVLRPLLMQRISKFRAIKGKKFVKGTRKENKM
jgi:hypothetical protein